MTISSVNVSTLLQQMQQSLFGSLDKNADGVLSQSEFQAIGQNVPASANTAASSGSGGTSTVQSASLTASSQSFSSEILQALLSLQGGGSPGLGQDAALAKNASDLTSFDPASAASSLEQNYGSNGSMTQSQFESAMKSLDSNSGQGGGQVGHHHHHHHSEGAGSTQAADQTFQAADANGDGQLSTSELGSYLSAQQQTAQQGVAQYQATSDLLSGFLSNLLSAAGGGSTAGATTATTQAVTT